MKKLFALILCIAAILVAGTVIASAEILEEAGYYIIKSEKTDEILAGQAGEGDIQWEVPFLHITPTLDGTIEKNEYLPFEMYEDYLSWLANSTDPTSDEIPNTKEDFQMFYDATQEDFIKPYWGWDGNYLYLAFEVNLVNGFTCTPEVMGGDMFLWAYNCLQVGLSPADATGTNGYTELGFGVHSETNEPITFSWFGNYCPEAGTDFMGYYDEDSQVLRYEMRIHLQAALGLTDTTIENGDTMNFAWVLSTNGETTGPYDVWHMFFCHGISGPHAKNAANMARVTFTGKPAGGDIPTVDVIPGLSEEDKLYGLKETIDLSDEKVVNTFEGENAAVEFITEGEESFMRITSLSNSDYPYVYSTKYPRNIVGGLGDYVVVKYRTSSPEGEDLGMIFRNVFDPEYHPDNCYTDIIGTDGKWHTTIFYMMDDANWRHFILNIGLVPFAYSDQSAQETIDIAWIKFYQEDPIELYYEDFYDPDAEDETEVPVEDETVADGEEITGAPTEDGTNAPEENVTQAPSAETDAEADTKAQAEAKTEAEAKTDAEAQTKSEAQTEAKTEASETAADGTTADTAAPEESGCASSVMVGASLLALCLAGAAVMLKKKED